ncbi:MAG: hypothetical protein GY727_15310 [Gammaproteobacteria bacterium]|nr:hypothetical protein [Gammaproteobacteria bacterium]MCP4091402.1 hypothetical protein [Gammaproteobacteria bacterium]MCP4831438.1 hypothetical protein [Gammaproteobacteria bacterium]MCP4930212.1 hypothetical protein [Gammaproteobacteria bacterium]
MSGRHHKSSHKIDTTFLSLTGQDLWGNLNADLDSLSLAERSNIVDLDRQLHGYWGLGRNFILGWCATATTIELLVVPHYTVAEYALASNNKDTEISQSSLEAADFVMGLLSHKRQLDTRQMGNAAKLLGVAPAVINLRQPLTHLESEIRIIEKLVTRYGVSYVQNRAVALFDIVGFSLLSPFEQMTQLNSLSYSLNAAHNKMLDRKLNVNFARSSTGDGFYIWNRDLGVSANTNLYHLMHLVLADNAIARSKAHGRTVPLLRAAFHLGSCYEFHQAEGLNPTVFSDIVGDVTIELARMVEHALPGQVLVGDFNARLPGEKENTVIELDAIAFVDYAQINLSQLNGLVLSGEEIESIKCYLTGEPSDDGLFSIRKLCIEDKHGLNHMVFNAKINIYRRHAEPILLGIEDRVLRGNDLAMTTASLIMPDINP